MEFMVWISTIVQTERLKLVIPMTTNFTIVAIVAAASFMSTTVVPL